MRYLIYTEKEAGEFKVINYYSEAEFRDLVKNCYFEYHPPADVEPIKVYPKYAALVETIDNFDFVLGRPR